jgi:glucosamine--fructose-6-phosphate aminotransferase (isomerizing)
MCGIVAYISNCIIRENNLIDNSIKGILPRGYDSVGIMRKYDSSPIFSKTIANVNDFVCDLEESEHNLMIGHTRWATCGKISIENTHPHVDEKSLFAVVHNGIITNFKMLIKEYGLNNLKSETDTEVIVQVMSKEYQKSSNVEDAFNKTISRLKGTWAMIMVPLFINEPILLIHCNEMPIVISRNKEIISIASEYTGIPFENGTCARLEQNKTYTITPNSCLDISSLEYKEFTNTYTNYHQHNTIKEIYEQPMLARNLCLPSKSELNEYEYLVLIGCGSSLYAANIVAYEIRATQLFKVVLTLDGSNYDENDLPNSDNVLVMFLSQSGETKELLNIAKINSFTKWCIVNNDHSSLISLCDKYFYMNLGKELGVASTKSVMAQILFMRHIFVKNIEDKLDEISNDIDEQIRIANNVSLIKFPDNVFVLGNKERYGVAQEISLKLKEICYIHAEAFANNALRHGPFTLLNENSLCILIDDNNIQNIKNQICARECPILIIPYHRDALMQLIYSQILCYKIAVEQKNHNPDYPKNIAKVVTVD